MRFPHGDTFVVGLSGPDGIPDFWLSPATGSETRELHLAFRAADRNAVDAVYEAAVTAGAEVLHAPREWPEYHPDYYGVGLRGSPPTPRTTGEEVDGVEPSTRGLLAGRPPRWATGRWGDATIVGMRRLQRFVT